MENQSLYLGSDEEFECCWVTREGQRLEDVERPFFEPAVDRMAGRVLGLKKVYTQAGELRFVEPTTEKRFPALEPACSSLR